MYAAGIETSSVPNITIPDIKTERRNAFKKRGFQTKKSIYPFILILVLPLPTVTKEENNVIMIGRNITNAQVTKITENEFLTIFRFTISVHSPSSLA